MNTSHSTIHTPHSANGEASRHDGRTAGTPTSDVGASRAVAAKISNQGGRAPHFLSTLQRVARAYKAGILDDAWLDKISTEHARRAIADSTDGSAAVEKARQRARKGFLVELQTKIKKL